MFMIKARAVTSASTGLHRLTQIVGNSKAGCLLCCYLSDIWLLQRSDMLSVSVELSNFFEEGEEIEGGSWTITVAFCIQSVGLTGKMNLSSLFLIMTHFPGLEKRGGAGQTDGGWWIFDEEKPRARSREGTPTLRVRVHHCFLSS